MSVEVLISTGTVKSLQGNHIKLQADTICIHGDGIHALSFAKKINHLFIKTGIQISAI